MQQGQEEPLMALMRANLRKGSQKMRAQFCVRAGVRLNRSFDLQDYSRNEQMRPLDFQNFIMKMFAHRRLSSFHSCSTSVLLLTDDSMSAHRQRRNNQMERTLDRCPFIIMTSTIGTYASSYET